MNTPKQLQTWEVPLSIAPMMQRTDRHYRYMMRCITERTLLWTEMVTSRAILHGDRSHLLDFHEDEHPLVLQIGGDDPGENAEVAKIAEEWGYDEININVGCPSDRVQNGNFGACLMLDPGRVAACVEAMAREVSIPVTVKHRIGVDERDQYEDMLDFVDTIAAVGGCMRFTVHARKAWLQGLSPKENRNIPPLRYEEVWRLKQERPDVIVEINGGIKTLDEVKEHLEHVDAVMLGRAAYDRPMLFAEADRDIFGEDVEPPSPHEVARAMMPYIEERLREDNGCKLHHITRHMVNLFAGYPRARSWRRYLSENHHLEGKGAEVVEEALAVMPSEEELAERLLEKARAHARA